MVSWKNLDTLAAYDELGKMEVVKLAEVMAGESGAERVKKYSVPMAEGLAFNYGAKQVDDNVLAVLAKLAKEAEVKEMWLTHYSPSLTRPEEFMDDVREIFPNSKPGKDGMTVELDFPEN